MDLPAAMLDLSGSDSRTPVDVVQAWHHTVIDSLAAQGIETDAMADEILEILHDQMSNGTVNIADFNLTFTRRNTEEEYKDRQNAVGSGAIDTSGDVFSSTLGRGTSSVYIANLTNMSEVLAPFTRLPGLTFQQKRLLCCIPWG